jgi:hypothetical protein
MLVLGVCASLAVSSLGAIGSAEARVPDGDRITGDAMICGTIQDDWDSAKRNRDSATSGEEKAYWSQRMKESVDGWYANNCDDYYGRIARMEQPSGQIKNIGDGGVVGVRTPSGVPAAQPVGLQGLH